MKIIERKYLTGCNRAMINCEDCFDIKEIDKSYLSFAQCNTA